MSLGPRREKFNIVNNDHGRTQKCDFCVPVGKTNFTVHHTPDTITSFRESVLVCKMHDSYCTIGKNFEHFHSFSSGALCGWWRIPSRKIRSLLIYVKTSLEPKFIWFHYKYFTIILLKREVIIWYKTNNSTCGLLTELKIKLSLKSSFKFLILLK